MATISENLQILKDSTDAIKLAIIDKGGVISGDISTWADAITGISGGGSSEESGEEIVFYGSKSSQITSVNYNGTLHAPEDISRGYLVMMDYYMILRTTFQYISSGSQSISLSLDYSEPLSGYENPVLILLYALPGDSYGQWRSQIVKFTNQSGGSSN